MYSIQKWSLDPQSKMQGNNSVSLLKRAEFDNTCVVVYCLKIFGCKVLKTLRTVTVSSYSIQAVLPRLQQYITAVYINTLQQFNYSNALIIAVSIFIFCSLLEINFILILFQIVKLLRGMKTLFSKLIMSPQSD